MLWAVDVAAASGEAAAMLKVKDIEGLWRRSLIEYPDGRRDSSTEVRWLQGHREFADLRQPARLPSFAHASGLDQLSMADCAALAVQQGFAGILRCDDHYFEWDRQIDFQPLSATADAGSLEFAAGALIERGRHAAYVEHWHRDDSIGRHPSTAWLLRDAEEGTMGLLLRVGPMFMFARARAEVVTAAQTLSEAVAGASSLAAAHRLIDCEISFGDDAAAGFRVTRSTLPYRVGCRLQPYRRCITHPARPSAKATLTLNDQTNAGVEWQRVWEIVGGHIEA